MSERAEQMRALYAEIPALACKRKCQGCCGPIGMSTMEYERIAFLAGTPPLKPGLTCPYLSDAGLCIVYDSRPLICRMWGAVETSYERAKAESE